MDFGDADSEKWLEYSRTSPAPLSWALRLEGNRVRAAECRLGTQFDAGSVNAPRERDVLSSYVHTPISVIPNGVDLEYFQPAPTSGRGHVRNRIIFTGGQVFDGTGSVRLNDQEHPLERGDIIAVPAWTEFSLTAAGQLDLFTFSDAPVFEKLHLLRTEIT